MVYKIIQNFLTDEEYKKVLWAVKTGKKNSTKVLACHKGLENRALSFTFGYRPPQYNKLKTQMPSRCALYRTNPKNDFILSELAILVEAAYKKYLPIEYLLHKGDSKQILDCWRIRQGIYTQGIVNTNNRLKLHVDRGNTENCISAMLTLKKNIEGGNLIIDDPKHKEEVENQDNSLLFFRGNNYAHYVQEFNLGQGGYRYSIVFYTHRSMIGINDPLTEIKNSQQRRIKLEAKRYGL